MQARANLDLARRAAFAAMPQFLALGLLGWGAGLAHDAPAAMLGAFAVLALLLPLRVRLARRYERCPAGPASSQTLPLAGVLLPTALLWGLLIALVVVRRPLPSHPATLAIAVLAGLCAGAFATIVSHWKLYVAYLSIILLPPLAAALRPAKAENLPALSALVMLGAFLYFQGRRLHDSYWAGLHDSALLDVKLQELETARTQAEQARHARTTFLANISHEICNPLNAILGMTELTLASGLTREQREMVEHTRAAAQTLFTLLHNVLAFSKLAAGQVQVAREPFLLDAVLEEIATPYRAHSRASGVEFRLMIHPAVPRRLSGDAGLLAQLLKCLLDNAFKFTHRGHVALDVLPGATHDALAQVQFRVSDTGPGIPPELLPIIFEPFVQGDASRRRRYGGAGLGLAVAHRLAGCLGGTLSLESTPGQGTVFTVSLPFGAVRENPRRPRRAPTAAASTLAPQ